jgi:hypothetical protein
VTSLSRIRLFLDSSVHTDRLRALDADQLIEDYRRLIKLTNPELVPYPDKNLVQASRYLIRHEADVPVLLSAMRRNPDWLLTHNTKHFTNAVARRTSLRIATPAEFFRTLSALLP